MNPLDGIKPYIKRGGWECDYPIDHVWPFLEDQATEFECNLDPDFQRGHVWTLNQQAAWLEHFFRGGDTGRRIYFNMPGWLDNYHGTLELIDGKQRLEAIRALIANEVRIFGYTWSELVPKKDRLLLVRLNTIKLNINSLETRKEVLQWYLQMNDGGTQHTLEELSRVRGLFDAE